METATVAAVSTPTTTPSAPPSAPSGAVNTEQNVPGAAAQQTDSSAPVKDTALYDVVIDGKSQRLTLEQLKAKASLAEAAHKRFEEAAKISKAQEAQKAKMKQDFIGHLIENGLTKDEIRAKMESWYKEEFIDPETLTPEQRELQALKKFKEQIDYEKKTTQEKEAQRQEAEVVARFREEYQKNIIGMLEKYELPKNRFTVGRVAYWQKQNLDNGYDAPDEVIVAQVKEERQNILREETASASPAELIAFLGDDVVNKIRKYDLEQLKKKFSGRPTEAPKSTPQNKSGRKMRDVDKYFNELRRSK